MKLKVKGINDGLLMTLPNSSWEECCEAVLDTIGENAGFYSGANLFLDAGSQDIRVVEITNLRHDLEKQGVSLKGIFGSSEKTRQNCKSLGLMTEQAVSVKSFRKEKIEESQPVKGVGEPAFLVHRTVRSGTVIERKESIIVLGDVNPGAEIISERNVIVLGTVRGRVSSGCSGETGSYVGAYDFDNAQVMVNGYLALISKDSYEKPASGLVMVRNISGEIEIETK